MELPAEGDILAEKYRIGPALGAGGFGTVVRAEDVVVGRPVAIKMLTPGKANLTSGRRFLREMRAIAQLASPHTLTLFDYGRTASGVLYMVTELVEGRDLSELLVQRSNMSPASAVHVLLQVLYSLAEAHGQGLVHRDIKPSNIRLFRHQDDALRVKVLDFGLARSFDDDSARVTKTGNVIGTPRYMSPEQLLGLPLSPATDIYSTGLVALEMLEGRESLLRKAHSPTPIRLEANVDPQLAAIIDRMVARDVAQRYPDAPTVIRELRPLRRAFSLPAPPIMTAKEPEPPHQPLAAPAESSSPSRRLTLWVLAGLVVLAFVLVGVWLGRPQDEAPPAPRELPRALVSAASPESEPQVIEEPSPAADKPLCRGRPAPFVGPGELELEGAVGGRFRSYIPTSYDGRRKYGVLIHRVVARTQPVVVNGRLIDVPPASPQDKRAPERALIRELADRLDLVVVELAFTAEDGVNAVNDALDAAIESLCIAPNRLWAYNSQSDAAEIAPVWCKTPVGGLVTVGSARGTTGGGVVAVHTLCPMAHLRILRATPGPQPEASPTRLFLPSWGSRLIANQCADSDGEAEQFGDLACATFECAAPTTKCLTESYSPADYEPVVRAFIRKADGESP